MYHDRETQIHIISLPLFASYIQLKTNILNEAILNIPPFTSDSTNPSANEANSDDNLTLTTNTNDIMLDNLLNCWWCSKHWSQWGGQFCKESMREWTLSAASEDPQTYLISIYFFRQKAYCIIINRILYLDKIYSLFKPIYCYRYNDHVSRTYPLLSKSFY